MPKRINLVGQKFNHLTVIQLDEEKTQQSKRTHWIVECDCPSHTRFTVLGSNLKRGNTTKCKYCKAENLIGQKFNRLLVIDRVIKDEKVYWKCLCDCGNEIILRPDSLRSGHTKSCGCLQREKVSQLNFKDLTGQKFGRLTAIKRSERKNNSGQYYWYCDCECGTTSIEIDGKHLIQGDTLSCGCLKSKGEEKISQILTDNNISFIKECRISDFVMTTGGCPRFDFAILNPDKSIAYFIEYNGEQHYIARGNRFTEERVKIIQQRDKEKEEYCNKNNIPLICIKYTDYDNLNLEQLYFPNYIKNKE